MNILLCPQQNSARVDLYTDKGVIFIWFDFIARVVQFHKLW